MLESKQAENIPERKMRIEQSQAVYWKEHLEQNGETHHQSPIQTIHQKRVHTEGGK